MLVHDDHFISSNDGQFLQNLKHNNYEVLNTKNSTEQTDMAYNAGYDLVYVHSNQTNKARHLPVMICKQDKVFSCTQSELRM